MTAELSRRLGKIWSQLIWQGFITWQERQELSKDIDKWNHFTDIPEKLRKVIIDFETKYGL